jgi:hypothetical protein
MPTITDLLPQYSIVREANANDIPRVERILADAEASNDPFAALPYFRGVRRIPGVWLVALPDVMKGIPGGAMVEALYRSASEKYPSATHTANWLILIDRSFRVATKEECLAHFALQAQKKAEMEEAELLRKKSRAVTVKPADAADFSGGADLAQLKEKLRVLKEIKALEEK